jgi:copper chaperone
MTTTTWKVDNLKCAGCGNTITRSLSKMKGVKRVEVHVETGEIVVVHDELDETNLKSKLAKIGYPPAGESNKLQSAMSYVSCAIGKI